MPPPTRCIVRWSSCANRDWCTGWSGLNAFVGCIDGGEHAHDAAQFLICVQCGAVTELDDHGISHSVAAAAAAAGFTPRHATVEVEGVCSACRATTL